MSIFMRLAVILSVLVLSAPAQAGRFFEPNLPVISYVTFESLDETNPLEVPAQFRVPAGTTEPVPAVVIVHGSSGIDSRGSFYAEALNRAGIATLEIDMWAPRGWFGGIFGRPSGVPETLPDAYGALKFLSEQPLIDADRIGIMGFSWGGVVTMLTNTQPYTSFYTGGEYSFAAHVAHYPVCWVYNLIPGYEFNSFTGSPLLIQTGELDDYDLPDTCQNLADSLPADGMQDISVKVFPNAFHAFDRLQPAVTIVDPFSNLGQGGEVEIAPSPFKALKARRNAVHFFEDAFGMNY